MENAAPISLAFLVKLVIRLMTPGAAGFSHKTETVGNVSLVGVRRSRNTLCSLEGEALFWAPPNSVRQGPLLRQRPVAGQHHQTRVLDQGRLPAPEAARLAGRSPSQAPPTPARP